MLWNVGGTLKTRLVPEYQSQQLQFQHKEFEKDQEKGFERKKEENSEEKEGSKGKEKEEKEEEEEEEEEEHSYSSSEQSYVPSEDSEDNEFTPEKKKTTKPKSVSRASRQKKGKAENERIRAKSLRVPLTSEVEQVPEELFRSRGYKGYEGFPGNRTIVLLAFKYIPNSFRGLSVLQISQFAFHQRLFSEKYPDLQRWRRVVGQTLSAYPRDFRINDGLWRYDPRPKDQLGSSKSKPKEVLEPKLNVKQNKKINFKPKPTEKRKKSRMEDSDSDYEVETPTKRYQTTFEPVQLTTSSILVEDEDEDCI